MRTKWITPILLSIALGVSLNAQARCTNCGVVTEVKTVKQKGEGSGVGAVAGGVVGGVLGHQIGGGRGKDLATIAGAAGGAYAGHQAEKKIKEKTVYQIIVKMENGQVRTFTYENEPGFRSEDKVKIINGKLTRA